MAQKLNTYTATGAIASTKVSPPSTVFMEEVQPKDYQLIKLAYEAYLANRRQPAPAVKNRAAVRGGGRKPYRQKGTGRARTGSIRNPLWRGGGTIFGPTGTQNHQKRLTKKARQQALRRALSVNVDQIRVIEAWQVTGKTRDLHQLLTQKLKLERRILLVDDQPDPLLLQASRNLPQVTCQTAAQLIVVDVLDADTIVITKAGLEALSQRLGAVETTKAKTKTLTSKA